MQVNDFVRLVPTLIAYLVAQTSCFKSSRLAQFIPAWQQTTSDTEILIKWYHANILNSVPSLLRDILHQENVLVGKEQVIITGEISSLLEKAVIIETTREPGEFISSVFVRPKKGGSHRMILNFKNHYIHFKMDT